MNTLMAISESVAVVGIVSALAMAAAFTITMLIFGFGRR